MNYQLTLTNTAFHQLVDGFTQNPERMTAICPAGVNYLLNRVELLVHTIRWNLTDVDGMTPYVLVVGSADVTQLPNVLHSALSHHPTDVMSAILALGVGAAAGHLTGVCLTPRRIEPLHTLTIIGAGLTRVHFPSRNASHTESNNTSSQQPDFSRWSRTIGALGEGTWENLTSLHIGVIGCGRTGSLVATSLARLGLQRLTLIDPDCLEPHNIGEMDAVTPNDIGQPKAHAVASFLRTYAVLPNSRCHQLVDLPDSIFSLSAFVAVKQADLLLCCVDDAAARLAATFLATLYLKPLLDIGTGIIQTDTSPEAQNSLPPLSEDAHPQSRAMGADIRLTLPGDRCLLCLGGIAHLEQARLALLNDQPQRTTQQDWHQQRAGSLRSLNAIAAHFALRLLEDFAARRMRNSVWLHLEFNDVGIPTLEHRTSPNSRCPICALTGQGDDRSDALFEVLERL